MCMVTQETYVEGLDNDDMAKKKLYRTNGSSVAYKVFLVALYVFQLAK